MSGQEVNYLGYMDTNTIRTLSGLRSETLVSDEMINSAIQGAEEKINDDTNLSWYPYPKDSLGNSLGDPNNKPPFLIREICKFYAIAFLRAIYPDEEDTYQKNVDLADKLLAKFLTTNVTVQATGGTGDAIVSDPNADTNNPEAEPDLTAQTFNRDYLPSYL